MAKTPNVSFIRNELQQKLSIYGVIQDCLDGQGAIKNRTTNYLPMPNPSDLSEANKLSYKNYLARAVFYNVCHNTLSGLVGEVFLTPPIVTLPVSLNPLIADATGTGENLDQLIKKALSTTIAFSRAGIFVDYPPTVLVDEKGEVIKTGPTIQDLEEGNIRPNIFVYKPGQVINWRVAEIGAKEVLSLVVLYELFEIADDGFETVTAGQYRVLKLVNNVYIQELWRERKPTKRDTIDLPPSGSQFKLFKTISLTGADGKQLSEIPFKFIGSENNDTNVDNPNFADMALINIAHFRNSADYEQSLFIVGQPTPVFTGLDKAWVNDVMGGVAKFGSGSNIVLPANATAELLQPDPNIMPKEGMEMKEKQMLGIGAKLVQQSEVQRTATETKDDSVTKTSKLGNTAKNVADAFTFAFRWCVRFAGGDENAVSLEINTDFSINNLTVEDQNAAVDKWQKGAITFKEMRAVLRNSGVATEDDDEALLAIQQEQATALATEVDHAGELAKVDAPNA